MYDNDVSILLEETLEQVSYALSNRFVEKWRHKYSSMFIEVFQSTLLKSLKDRKPARRSSLYSLYTKRYKYAPTTVDAFFQDVDLGLYHPFILSS